MDCNLGLQSGAGPWLHYKHDMAKHDMTCRRATVTLTAAHVIRFTSPYPHSDSNPNPIPDPTLLPPYPHLYPPNPQFPYLLPLTSVPPYPPDASLTLPPILALTLTPFLTLFLISALPMDRNCVMRYRPNLRPNMKNLSFRVEPGTKAHLALTPDMVVHRTRLRAGNTCPMNQSRNDMAQK